MKAISDWLFEIDKDRPVYLLYALKERAEEERDANRPASCPPLHSIIRLVINGSSKKEGT